MIRVIIISTDGTVCIVHDMVLPVRRTVVEKIR